MTTEELEKEAEDFLQKKWGTSKMLILGGDAREVLADFAEPREKRIAELEQENAELKARVSEQSERISELVQELDDKINRFG